MINWIVQNWGTVVICIVLALIVFAISYRLIKNKRAGKSSCSCGCTDCAGCAGCAAKENSGRK